MARNYWDRVLTQRKSRRRMLAGTGGMVAGSVLLAACGGDDDSAPSGSSGSTGGSSSGGTGSTGSSGATGGSSGLLTEPTDTIGQATRGGTMGDWAQDSSTLDPGMPVFSLNPVIKHVYSTLLREKAGHLKPADGSLEADLAEGWELSPDRTEITIKVRTGAKWHNKAPVNGREIDIDDVLFSWKRYTEQSPFRGLTYNAVNPEAPILSVEATDDRTLLVKLKEPLVYAVNYFASYGSLSGNMIMVPKETDDSFDIRRDMIGHGPFMLDSYEPSIGFKLVRHPEYFDPNFAYLDGIDMPIIAEYSAQLAQFKAGKIHYMKFTSGTANPEDILAVKKEQDDLLLYPTDFTTQPWIMSFGWLPAGQSPFMDERVRQAVSMSLDRDTWIDAFYNVSGFESAGLPVETRWNSALLADWNNEWLDPQGSDFGENAKYYQQNLTDAKALMSAAGFPDGFNVKVSFPQTPLNLSQQAETLAGMMSDIGIQGDLSVLDYQSEYIPTYRDGSGQYEGISLHSVSGTMPQLVSPASALVAEYYPKSGVTFHGFSVNGQPGDPELAPMLEKLRLEAEPDASLKLVQDIQRYLGKAMYALNMPGGASGFTMGWPALQNYQVWRTRSTNSTLAAYQLWLDQTKAPFA